MRIWDIHPKYLCRQHLLGEHRELHAIWIVITKKKKGYSRHPETLRWFGKLNALFQRHELLVKEMTRRGYHHYSPLKKVKNMGSAEQTSFVNTIKEQKEILRKKGCECQIK
jgi:hypothetical protein